MTDPAADPGAARLPRGSFLDDPAVQRVLSLLDADGERAYVVGGAVRNALIDRAPGDIDVATTAEPPVVMRRARKAGLRAVPTGIEHGTVTLLVDHAPFEVTTLRRDVSTDGRRATVTFSRDIADDAFRRDFTMNALYATADGQVLDPVGGLPDLAARRVRFIGDAETRIREDYLRILRLFRFHADYGEGPLDEQARDSAIRMRDGLSRLSAERIRTEWLKLLAARRAVETLVVVAEAGFADRVLGRVARLGAFSALVAGWPASDPLARLGALVLHGRHDAEPLSERLRLSRAEGRRLEVMGRLVDDLHGRSSDLDAAWTRRLLHAHGTESAAEALAVALAADGADVGRVMAGLTGTLSEEPPRSPFTGSALLLRGLAPGPLVGAVLASAESAWREAGFPDDAASHEAILTQALARCGAGEPR